MMLFPLMVGLGMDFRTASSRYHADVIPFGYSLVGKGICDGISMSVNPDHLDRADIVEITGVCGRPESSGHLPLLTALQACSTIPRNTMYRVLNGEHSGR